MVAVQLFASLRPFADDRAEVEVEAKTVGEVLARLAEKHPGLAPRIEAGVSVAVDGRVIASGLTEPVKPDSEVVIMERIKGG
ncbi:MAG: MoaD/ThiS family protein [Pseudomonadota bacterium]